MSLVLVRVDCRLIHGQVIEAWVPYTRAECLVVANDEAAGDLLTKSIMEMAVPPSVDVAILPVQDAARVLTSEEYQSKRTLALVASCHDALSLHESGLVFDHLNLGNLICTPGKTQVTCSISLDNEDMRCLRLFETNGVRVEARPVPQAPAKILTEIIPFGPIPK